MKTYLGDAVYADFDGYFVVLTTEDGIQEGNKIYLDDGVVDALLSFLNTIRIEQEGDEGMTISPEEEKR